MDGIGNGSGSKRAKNNEQDESQTQHERSFGFIYPNGESWGMPMDQQLASGNWQLTVVEWSITIARHE
jgi:hypothetical protein